MTTGGIGPYCKAKRLSILVDCSQGSRKGHNDNRGGNELIFRVSERFHQHTSGYFTNGDSGTGGNLEGQQLGQAF